MTHHSPQYETLQQVLLLANRMSRYNFRLTQRRDFLRTAAIILLPMLIIVAENETGSALVYLSFLFMLYREGLSGWWLLLLLMIIVVFILTLVLSPYVALWVTMAVAAVCVCAERAAMRTFFRIYPPAGLLPDDVPFLDGIGPPRLPPSFLDAVGGGAGDVRCLSGEGLEGKEQFPYVRGVRPGVGTGDYAGGSLGVPKCTAGPSAHPYRGVAGDERRPGRSGLQCAAVDDCKGRSLLTASCRSRVRTLFSVPSANNGVSSAACSSLRCMYFSSAALWCCPRVPGRRSRASTAIPSRALSLCT